MPSLHTLDSLRRYRDYRLLWTSNFCANSAQWFQLLTVGWLVRELTAGSSTSALLVVTVGGASSLPVLLVGPLGGVLADRVDRRTLVMVTQGIMAIVAILFALLVHSGQVQVWHAYSYVILIGVGLAISRPVRQALIANTVPREDFGNAFATNTFTIAGTRMIGPLFGGVVILTLGFTWNFVVESAFYVTGVLVLLRMNTPYRFAAQGPNPGRSQAPYRRTHTDRPVSPLTDLAEGFRYIWSGDRTIFNLILLNPIANVLLNQAIFLLPVFTVEVLHRGADVGGYLLAASGFGALASAVTIASVGFVFKKGQLALVTLMVGSVTIIVFAHSQWFVMALILIILNNASLNAFRNANGTLIQLLPPDRLRGRITGLQAYGQGLVFPTSLLIGWFTGITSVTAAITIVGVVSLGLSITALLTSHKVRQLE